MLRAKVINIKNFKPEKLEKKLNEALATLGNVQIVNITATKSDSYKNGLVSYPTLFFTIFYEEEPRSQLK